MNAAIRKILVVGGNGFIGSAVCKNALARGIQVTSVSSSGRPYETAKGHTPTWATKVDWRKGDALRPDTFAELLPEVDGVVHTLGILIEDTRYKQAIKERNLLALASSLGHSIVGDEGKNPLEQTEIDSRNSYEAMNRDAALRVCEAFVSSSPSAEHIRNVPRPFVYVSAEDIFRPLIPARYIETKREAELGIEALMSDKPDYRGVYIRPSLVYHAHHRPITTPLAVLLDLSATLHRKAPAGIPTPSGILRAIGSLLFPHSESRTSTSPFDSIANALSIPPIHVDHVAEAIGVALDSSRTMSGAPLRGVIGVKEMREVVGWSDGHGADVGGENPRII